MKALRIVAWDDHYESAESRRIKTTLSWVRTPNGHDSVSFRRLLKHPNGMAHFGAWNLILQIASKCSTRGLLTFGKKHEPHTAETIADLTGGSHKVIEEAIARLLEIGWLETIDPADKQPSAVDALPSAGRPTDRGEEIRREERRGDGDRACARTREPQPPQPDPLGDSMRDIEQAHQRATKTSITPLPQDDWFLWRQQHPRLFIARSDEDGNQSQWQGLYRKYGKTILSAMYEHLISGLPERKGIGYKQALLWLTENTVETADGR